MKAHSRKARSKSARRRTRTTPWLVVGAVVATLPSLHGAERRPEALPVDRRIVLEPERLEAALGHVRIWTPSETLPLLRWQSPAAVVAQPTEPGPPVFTFAIAPGPLAAAVAEFERVSGVRVTVDAATIRDLTTDGVSGSLTAPQALTQLLSGSSLSHRFTTPASAVIEVRIDATSVVVSGTSRRLESNKYPAPVSETPQTIQVIPKALLDEQGAQTLTDALRNVPGITMQAGEGGGASNTSGDMFNMRGFSASNSLFVDNVRDDGLIARDIYNLEQVEVFSGPTGSDVGRTNAAGYINLATKTPSLEGAQSGTFSVAGNEQVRATVDINQPVRLGGSGTFLGNAAIRFNALWQDGGVPGRDYVERESRSIAPSIAFGLNTATRASLSAQVMRQDNLPDYGLPAAASPIGPLTATSVLAPQAVDQNNYYGSPDYDYDKVEQDSLTLRLEHDFNPSLTVRNQTRYNATTREAVVTSIGSANSYDPATNLVTLSRQVNTRENEIFSNQTNVAAQLTTGRVRHELAGGLEITSESQYSPGLTGAGTRAPIDVNNPDVFSPVLDMNIVPTGASTDGSTDTVAFYLFDAFDIGPRVRVNGGVRIERYETRSRSISTLGVPTDISGDGTLFSSKAGLVLRLNDQGNLYASYGSSLTPPGSSNFQLNAGATNQNNPNVDPQESTNFEVGTKWDLAGNRLLLTGAVFWTENKNVIYVVDGTAIPPVFNQDDGQSVKGSTISLVGRITPWWDVTASVQYLDSEVKSQNPATDGRRLALTPEFSGNLWTTVRLVRNIRIGAGLRYTDDAFINTANTTSVPGYAIADALVEVPVSKLLLRLNVYNITAREYVRGISNNGGRYAPGAPRSFLLSTAVRF
jgi:catecholate siderophore receptor